MKKSVHYPTVLIMFSLVFGSLFRGGPILAAGCPVAGFSSTGPYAAGTNPIAVAVGDFNGDGKADVAVANQQSDNITVLLGDGKGTFQFSSNYATAPYPQAVAVADLN